MPEDNYAAKKHLGQNFLRDTATILEFIDAARLSARDKVLEIGPGKGALTEYILPNVNYLLLVEVDKDMIEILKKKFSAENLEIRNESILDTKLEELLTDKKINKVIGSLPYNISKPIVAKFCMDINSSFDVCVFMLQKEVAHAYAGVGNKNTFLHCWLDTLNQVEIIYEVEKSKFVPIPKVDSSIIKIRRRVVSDYKIAPAKLPAYSKFLHNCFLNPRKKLLKNLKSIYRNTDWLKIFTENDINEGIRIEQLSSNQILQLFNSWSGN